MVPEQAEDRSLPWELEPQPGQGRTDWVSVDSPRRSAARDWQVLDGYSNGERRNDGETGATAHGAGPAHGADRRTNPSRGDAEPVALPARAAAPAPEVYSIPDTRNRPVAIMAEQPGPVAPQRSADAAYGSDGLYGDDDRYVPDAHRGDPRVDPQRGSDGFDGYQRGAGPVDGYRRPDAYWDAGYRDPEDPTGRSGAHAGEVYPSGYRATDAPARDDAHGDDAAEHYRTDDDPAALPAGPPARRTTGDIEIARDFDVQYGAADLMPDAFPSRPRHAMPPRSGWRRGIYRLTGGAVHPAESAAERRYNAQLERIRQPIRSDYRIALLSLKGGVGKTTTTIGLGSIFASVRGDNVIAVDANPDFGTLGGRVPQQTQSTVRDLLAAGPSIRRYSDVRVHSSQASSRLEVIAGERDPAASEAFTEADYRGVIDILRVHYNLILTDCGTGVMHSAMNGVLSLAHSLVLVTTPAVDGASSAAATLEWLQLHGYAHLAERTVVVVSAQRPGPLGINMEALQRHFLARCRAMVVVPFDEHLAEGGIVDIDRLRPRTRAAFVDLAAMVADDFPQSAGRHSAVVPGTDHRGW